MALSLPQLFLTIFLIGYLTNRSQAEIIPELLVVGGETTLKCQLNDTLSTTTGSYGLWYKDELEIDNAYSILNDNDSSSLWIQHAKPSDTGSYSYGVDDGTSFCEFSVIVGEYVSELSSDVIANGTTKHFFCHTNTSSVRWLKDGVEVESSTQPISNNLVILKLYAVAFTDSGNYSCVQGNQILGSVNVTVGKIPPKVDIHCYSHYNSNCKQDNNCDWAPITFEATNLQTKYNCTCYESYTITTYIGIVTNTSCSLDDVKHGCSNVIITSYNVLGSTPVSESVKFNHILIPHTPTDVRLTQDPDGSKPLHLSWTYPLCYNDFIKHYLTYKIRYKAVSNNIWNETKEIKENIEYTLPYNFDHFTEYEAQVKAKKYNDYSDWSESAYCTTDEAKPESQVEASYTSHDTDKGRDIVIKWQPLDKKYANGIILAYYLSLRNGRHVLNTTSVAANITSITFEGLKKEEVYYVNITAANSVGNSTVRMLSISAEPYSYNLVIIVVVVAFIIIIIAASAFLSWNKLKKADCMQPWPEPNFLNLSMYTFDLSDNYDHVDSQHEMFDDLKCQHPPEAEQGDLISFSSSDPILQPFIAKQVELPPTDIYDDSGLDQSRNIDKFLEMSKRKKDSHGLYFSLSLKKCSPQHVNRNSTGSVDTSGFNSRDTSPGQTKRGQLSPTRSMPDISGERSTENCDSPTDGYMRMNNSAQDSAAHVQETHTASDEHINDYVIRTFLPGGHNQFADNPPMNLQPPLPTPDMNLPSPGVNVEPPHNISKKKNIGSYVDHLQLQQLTRGASNSSPNLFTNPTMNSLSVSSKGSVKSASALHVDNRTTVSAASSGYILSSMMPALSGGAPGSSPDTALSGEPNERGLGSPGPAGQCNVPVSATIPADSLVDRNGPSTSQPVTQPARSTSSPQGLNPRRQQESNGCIPTANLPSHKKSNKDRKQNGYAHGTPRLRIPVPYKRHATGHVVVTDNSMMSGASFRNPPPESLPLYHVHSPAASRDSNFHEERCHRPSQMPPASPPSLPNHKTTQDKEVEGLSSVESGYVPLSSLSSPE